ncbi:MAG: tRNA epoxyqueuosine(34) reductase QueG [Gammaproteobacteria bacterium]|nr:tRNA epoxyqueuosine(34) reductase QueG [Gammaproteobacteria bacterium]MCI0590986.1 tRNA epoxyqueuosine(34) reductase QueG [Gammaproteobacteria bacterium]
MLPAKMGSAIDYTALARQIRQWGTQLGFQQVGISDSELKEQEVHLLNWLNKGMHGEMAYMKHHGTRRSRPNDLIPGTIRVISVRMDYLPPDAKHPNQVLHDPTLAYVSRYALGRDYHKVVKKRLQKLAQKIEAVVGPFGYRAFVDSAPVLEKALAQKAGLGWIGKHTNLINRRAGSWFFLGELYTDLPLSADAANDENLCGTCTACIDICPTKAIIGPYQLDARRCISYLTIELRGSIPIEYRPLIGNRIFGCDDCQLVCPWNRFAQNTEEGDFRTRSGLDAPALIDLFAWTEIEFLKRTEGSAIRRISYEMWLRNIAVALGNAPSSPQVVGALKKKQAHASELVREHVTWALEQHRCNG